MQFLVVQMPFFSISALWLLLLLKFVCKTSKRKSRTDQLKGTFSSQRLWVDMLLCLSWLTLYMLQIFTKTRAGPV